jgi:hypothetical protein
MSRVVVDPATGSQLRQAQQTLELVDPSGRLLGHFVPLTIPSGALEPKISEEELRRREQQGGGRPLAAILADLEKTA